MEKYNHLKIEREWQRIWQENGLYQTPDRIEGKENFYHLVMFPYPSGNLHIGHWYNFAGADVYARFKRMQGFNVLSPIGFDAFGLPAENAAIRHHIHPKTWTYRNIEKMRKQLKSIGAIYDWSREVITCDPGYYKWTQWLFLQFFKAGLVYKKKAPANFCPKCKSILANEQAESGLCWRCESQVEQREVEQWFFKITDFAQDLLKGLERLDWPEKTKLMQKNWIGKSEGAIIKFPIANFQFSIEVFTTRPDTLFGASYLVLAPEHPIVDNLKSQISNFKYVRDYIEKSKKKTERERISEVKEKTGIELKGIKAINPINNRQIPVFLADYVLMHYGTGAIMAVPCHDQRDFDFAKKFNLPMIEVISPVKEELSEKNKLRLSNGQFKKAYEEEGILINSGRFNGMTSERAKEKIVDFLAKKDLAKKSVCYKLRDWLISRQRYWGAPIPLIFCPNCKKLIEEAKIKIRDCNEIQNSKFKIKNLEFNLGEILNPGWIALPEENLPVYLPKIQDYLPVEGKSPLARSKKFLETICPKCQSPAKRETDTMDTFICSSWYYLRYADPQNDKEFASKEKIKNWLPVSIYIGGAEHAVLHLLYSRFFTKVLKNLGYLDFDEPFLKLRHQGIILGPDGQKMSKSRGNVIDPDEQVKKYGADCVRMYLCFMGPYDQGGPWDPKGITGIYRFLQKIWKLFVEQSKIEIQDKNLERLFHKTIKKVTEDIEGFRFNTAISALMILVNEIKHAKSTRLVEVSRNENAPIRIKYFEALLKLLAPFAPHLTEELWQKYILKVSTSDFQVSNSIHNQSWPQYDEKLIEEEKITLLLQVNGKVRDKIEASISISEKEAKELALSSEKIKKWIDDKEIKKVIYVPKKLINIVI